MRVFDGTESRFTHVSTQRGGTLDGVSDMSRCRGKGWETMCNPSPTGSRDPFWVWATRKITTLCMPSPDSDDRFWTNVRKDARRRRISARSSAVCTGHFVANRRVKFPIFIVSISIDTTQPTSVPERRPPLVGAPGTVHGAKRRERDDRRRDAGRRRTAVRRQHQRAPYPQWVLANSVTRSVGFTGWGEGSTAYVKKKRRESQSGTPFLTDRSPTRDSGGDFLIEILKPVWNGYFFKKKKCSIHSIVFDLAYELRAWNRAKRHWLHRLGGNRCIRVALHTSKYRSFIEKTFSGLNALLLLLFTNHSPELFINNVIRNFFNFNKFHFFHWSFKFGAIGSTPSV